VSKVVYFYEEYFWFRRHIENIEGPELANSGWEKGRRDVRDVSFVITAEVFCKVHGVYYNEKY
jgi:hypothetical protein